MNRFGRVCRELGAVFAMDCMYGGRIVSRLTPGGVWPSGTYPTDGLPGRVATRSGLVSYVNVKTDKGIFESASGAGTWSVNLPVSGPYSAYFITRAEKYVGYSDEDIITIYNNEAAVAETYPSKPYYDGTSAVTGDAGQGCEAFALFSSALTDAELVRLLRARAGFKISRSIGGNVEVIIVSGGGQANANGAYYKTDEPSGYGEIWRKDASTYIEINRLGSTANINCYQSWWDDIRSAYYGSGPAGSYPSDAGWTWEDSNQYEPWPESWGLPIPSVEYTIGVSP